MSIACMARTTDKHVYGSFKQEHQHEIGLIESSIVHLKACSRYSLYQDYLSDRFLMFETLISGAFTERCR